MSEEESSNGNGSDGQRSWLDRLSQAFSNDPQSREDLVAMLRLSHERGLIDTDALAMSEGALEVGDLQVRDVMVPRSHMVVLSQDVQVRAVLPEIIESGHSRFPVVGEDKDEVVGILLAKDLLSCFVGEDGDRPLRDFMRPAVIIPESKRLNLLLRDFRVSRNHMAIVVDEYGGVSGLATIEDVLEEIVGDIDDETDAEEVKRDIQKLDNGRYRVQALTPIEDFNAVLGTRFADDDYDTIGGMVVAEFGRVPEQGELVEIGGLRFQVTGADNRRIRELEID